MSRSSGVVLGRIIRIGGNTLLLTTRLHSQAYSVRRMALRRRTLSHYCTIFCQYTSNLNHARGKIDMKKHFCTVAGLLLLAAAIFAGPIQQEQQPASDNTKTNQGDASKEAKTADQQKMNPADRETTKKIRLPLRMTRICPPTPATSRSLPAVA